MRSMVEVTLKMLICCRWFAWDCQLWSYELENLELQWNEFSFDENLSIINKTKHPTTKGNMKNTRWKDSSLDKQRILWRGWTTKGTWTSQVPKQRILQKGGGIIKGTWTKSSTLAFTKSWEAYEIRRGNTSISFALVGCKWGNEW